MVHIDDGFDRMDELNKLGIDTPKEFERMEMKSNKNWLGHLKSLSIQGERL